MNITTINVRGLNNQTKKDTIFHWLEANRYDIVLLQETFCTKENEQTIFGSWEGKCFHSFSSSSHSKGVSILLSKHFIHKVINVFKCNDGRRILINIEHNDQVYTIVSLYAPTESVHRREFYNKTKVWIKEKSLNDNCIVIGGDLNCSLGTNDRKTNNLDSSRASFRDFIMYLELHDTYRELNKDKVTYTYSNSTGTIQSRIDYIFTSSYLFNLSRKCFVLKPPKVPDHKAVVAMFRKDIDIGKGYWKMNVELLKMLNTKRKFVT